MEREPLVDGHGRLIADLRVSVTDRCNFRCQYCMPAEGLPWLERDAVLSFGEISRIVELLSTMGVHDVRLTGGEPLVRKDFPELVARLGALKDVRDLSITTNGFLLERDAAALVAAGATRFNVSIDSLQRHRFHELTRRDSLDHVLAGLAALAAIPDVGSIKVNAVALRGFTEDEVPAFVELARSSDYQVRFIEFMPLDADHAWTQDQVLRGAELHAMIHALYPLEPLERDPSATARVYRFTDGRGRVGFINSVSEPFCGDCNRIRLTADGRLRTCLFSLHETDLREPLRADADDNRARADHSRCRLAQGAQASHRRAGVHSAGQDDVGDRRLVPATGAARYRRLRPVCANCVTRCVGSVPESALRARVRPRQGLASLDVSEQVFPSGSWASDDDRATTLASELLEQLLDAISRPGHDWPALNAQVQELSEIATAMATIYPPGADTGSLT